ncbi:hypothetical protein DZA35_01555 [Arcobacter sp. HD9-500m-PIT-SAG03]|nr:hypothetical protein DZA35_01555 [Arcobacter sp. HD9-500m-PIT-SAG03]
MTKRLVEIFFTSIILRLVVGCASNKNVNISNNNKTDVSERLKQYYLKMSNLVENGEFKNYY